MADKTVRYTLTFTADIKQARSQIAELQNRLDTLGKNRIQNSSFGFTAEINKALAATTQLQRQLTNAFNTETGRLDLTVFQNSLKKSGMSLKKYEEQLHTLGPAGDRAFISLAQSVANAEVPIKKVTGRLDKLKTTFVNTINWQLSATAMRTVIGSFQKAFSYAKALDTSLNKIRIVTGQSADEMARFAVQANKAAQQLSTTTTAYSDAALIYYQQGLSDEEVQKRTEATMKMAAVTGETASHVSSYMTAIWNNFAEGSDNLAYYTDVLTALGAATAASSEEIANGLEKFAAVGDTVGLSYEYATAALTTIIDKTRQSEDVVGTALKTLFARIQGLQQGETTDDGVDFNKYSKALAHVGIQILDNTGKLKDMDAILDEMGEKWGTLEKTEQVALAQTMGGTRQYVQLVSLMDNWDSMKKNVALAKGSSGSTQEQFDIYAESWQAASKRMQAATESVYQALLNDKFFIKLTDFFTGLIQQIEHFVKALGGLQGVLSGVGFLLTKIFASDISGGVNKLAGGIRNIKNIFQEFRKTGQESFTAVEKDAEKAANKIASKWTKVKNAGQEGSDTTKKVNNGIFARWTRAKETVQKNNEKDSAVNMKTEVLQMAQARIGEQTTLAGKTELKNLASTLTIQKELLQNQEKLTGATLARLEAEFDINQLLKTQAQKTAVKADAANHAAENAWEQAQFFSEEEWPKQGSDKLMSVEESNRFFNRQYFQKRVNASLDKSREVGMREEYLKTAVNRQAELVDKVAAETITPQEEGESEEAFQIRQEQFKAKQEQRIAEGKKSVQEALDAAEGAGINFRSVARGWYNFDTELQSGNKTKESMNKIRNSSNKNRRTFSDQVNARVQSGIITQDEADAIIAAFDPMGVAGATEAQLNMENKNIKKSDDAIRGHAAAASKIKRKPDTGQQITAAASAASATAMALSNLKGVVDTLGNADMSWTDKLISSFTSIGIVLPSVISSAKTLGTTFSALGTGGAFLLMAAIAGLVLAFGAIADAIETDEERAKRLAEELKRTADAANKAASAYKELQSSIDSIKDLQDTMKGLRKGTVEWTEAVIDLNNQVLMLLDKYPQLAEYVTQTDGVWHIKDEGFEEILRIQGKDTAEKQQEYFDKTVENERNKKDDLEKKNQLNIEYTVTDDPRPINHSDPLGDTNGGLPPSAHVEKLALNSDEQKKILQDINEHSYIDEETKERKIKWNEMETIKGGPVDYSNKEIQAQIENNTKAMIENTNTVDANSKALDMAKQQSAENWVNTHLEFDEDTSAGTKAAIVRNFSDTENFDKASNEVRAEMSKNHWSDDTYIENYAALVGKTEEQIRDEIKENEGALDIIKDTVFNNAVYQKMLSNSQTDLNSLSKSVNINDEILQNLLLTGGDNSAISSLEEEEKEALAKELRSLLFDEDRKEDRKIYENQFGADVIQEQLKVLNDQDYDQRVKDEKKAEAEAKYQNELNATAQELDMEPEALEAYTNALIEQNEAYKDNKAAAVEAAKAQIKFNDGANEAAEILKDNAEVFNNQNLYKGGKEWSEAIGKLTKSVSKMLNLDVDAEFITDHLGSIQKALNGDVEALKNLQSEAAKDWSHKFAEKVKTINKSYKDLNDNQIKTFDGKQWAADWSANIDAAIDHLNKQSGNFTLEADTSGALDSIVELTNEALMAGEMTKEEMESLFSSLGYSPEVKMVDGPENTTHTLQTGTISMNGVEQHVTSDLTTTTTTKVPQIKDADNKNGTTFTRTPTNASSLASSRKKNTPTTKDKGSAKDKKKASEEIERYHTMEKTLEALQKQLDKISKAKERAFGTDKIALMDAEIAKTQEIIKAQEDLYKEIEKNYAQDRVNAASIGAEFDAKTGAIINYEEVMQKALDDFNNSARGEADEAKYNQIKETLNQYEETYDKLVEESEELIELQNQLADLRLEKIEYKVELKINADERDLEILEYLFEKLDDETFDAAKRIAILSSQTDEYISKNKTLIEGITDILKETKMSKDEVAKFMAGEIGADELQKLGLTQAQVDALLDKRSKILENNKSLLEIETKIWEEVTKAIQGGAEELNKVGEAIEHNKTLLESYKNIIDLIGADTLGVSQEIIAELGKATLDTVQKDLANSINKLETLRQAEAGLRQKILDPNLTEESKKEIQKSLDETIKLTREAEKQVLEDLKTSVETAKKIYEDVIDSIIKNTEKGLSGIYGSLEQLQQAFERQKKINEVYVEDYKKVYELSKLNRDLTKSIDETDNLSAKNKLRDIQKEINNLQAQGVKLSEYDIENMRKKYELRLAEIALEEAQNAKNQVRMTRDSEGNWNYTYTADEISVADAEQAYEDKLFAMQEANQSYIQSLQDSILSTESDMLSKIAEIMKSDDIDEKDKIPRAKEVYADYMKILEGYAQQLNEVLGNNEELAMTKFGTFEDYLNKSNSSITTHFDQTSLSLFTGFNNIWSYMDNLKNKIGDINNKDTLLGGMASAWTDWTKNLENNLTIAGTSIDNFSLDVTKAKDSILKDNIELQKNSTDTANKVSANNQQSAQSAYDYSRRHSDAIQKVINKNEILVIGLDNIIKKESGIEISTDKANKKLKESPSIFDKATDAAGKLVPVFDKLAISAGNASDATENLNTLMNNMSKKTSSSQKEGSMTDFFTNIGDNLRRQLAASLGYIFTNAGRVMLSMYDTGGYTGEWGSSGKLAVLHEKEIVLNKKDTENMLKTVDMVRSISNMIDLNTKLSTVGNLISATVGNTDNSTNQQITINAEFPDVTSSQEIENAFDNLINKASQYANRKN